MLNYQLVGAQSIVTSSEIKTILMDIVLPAHEIEGERVHHHSHLPEGAEFLDAKIKNNNLQVYFSFENEPDDFIYDGILEQILPALEEYDLDELEVFEIKENGEIVQLDKVFVKLYPVEYLSEGNSDTGDKTGGQENAEKWGNPHVGQPSGGGSLSGKTVWLSPGHGWLWNNGSNAWLTQRGNTNGMVEDFGSIENVNQQLQQYLINAGANVWSVRERDMNTNEVIVDNDDGAPTYVETGTWSTSSSTGYNGSTYNFVFGSATTTATAIYTPNIPKEGWYWISVQYREGTNRAIDTQYEVNHAGGSTIVNINQEVHGLTWVYLGQFYFDQGSAGNVTLLNRTTDAAPASQAIIADAVRFGGGKGNLNDCAYPSSPISNKDRYDESARQFARFQGYPNCENDPTTRPRYAEWELLKGTNTEQNNAIYLSLHSNAFNGTARGTETYMYNGAVSPILPNTQLLRDLVQQELAGDIIADWDAGWNDRGTNSANFGELRNLTTMPGCLVELAFHDNAIDADAMKTPYFRNLSARAMYKGIVNFFNQTTGSPSTISPEPPTHMMAFNDGAGQITLNWDPPSSGGVLGDAAAGYNVYVSTHGYGFQDAIPVSGTAYTVTGLLPNTTYYFQVSATNTGGESFPTATVAARTPSLLSCDSIPMLIVDGFDRLDRASNVKQYESAALGTVDRMFLERMNAYDYMVKHARSISSCNIPFDGASNEAIIAGYMNLNDYAVLDWYTGEESTADRTFDATEQSLLTTYLNGGGKWIVSGAEIGWDIGRGASANASVSFYNTYLKATYVGDDGGTYNFIGSGIFGGITGVFDDGNNCEFNAEFPDRLGAIGGSSVVLNYSGGTSDGAAVAFNGNYGVVYFGFPLETINSDAIRDVLICDALTFLGIKTPPDVAGCMDMTACNFDPLAECDDGSCELPDGCTDPMACNYDMNATCDDGSCLTNFGCTITTACNYDLNADCDDNSCVFQTACDTDACTNGGVYTWNTTACACVLTETTVLGCTDMNACNYDFNANCDDNSCIIQTTCDTDPCTNGGTYIWNTTSCACVLEDVRVNGCTDNTACNFDSNANCDDSSCIYQTTCDNNACTNSGTYIWSTASCACELDIATANGCMDATACNYDVNANCDDSSCIYQTACDTDPCTNGGVFIWDNVNCGCVLDEATILGCTSPGSPNYDMNANCDDNSCQCTPDGCDDPTACNFDMNATCNNGTCIYETVCDVDACTNGGIFIWDNVSCSCQLSHPTDQGCTDNTACNYDPAANCDNSSCIYEIACDSDPCTNGGVFVWDVSACTCQLSVSTLSGCTDVTACNYDANANCDNSTCVYQTTCDTDPCTNGGIYVWDNVACQCELMTPENDGCTDMTACNYDSAANCDDSSCVYQTACDTDPCTNGGTFVWNNNTCSCIADIPTINGCTNASACNYDSAANCDDGNCIFQATCDDDPCTNGGIYTWNNAACQCMLSTATDLGCTNPSACNYDATANCDNGSCIFQTSCDLDPCTNGGTYFWDNNTCACVIDVGTNNGCTNPNACNYNPSANCDNGSCILQTACDTDICTNGGIFVWNDATCECVLEIETMVGCMDNAACNFDPSANCPDPAACIYQTSCDSNPCTNGGIFTWDTNTCSCQLSQATILGCTNATSANYDPNANCDDSSCLCTPDGCVDPLACNYDSSATCNDGSCIYEEVCDIDACTNGGVYTWNTSSCSCELTDVTTEGCNDPTACNYATAANCNDGSCIYEIACNQNPCVDGGVSAWSNISCSCELTQATITGCADPTACNYDANVNCDDAGTCDYLSCGCTPDGCDDPQACNFDPTATCNDSSCIYETSCDADPCANGGIYTWDTNSCSCQLTMTTVVGCADPTACNYDVNANCNNPSLCDFTSCVGGDCQLAIPMPYTGWHLISSYCRPLNDSIEAVFRPIVSNIIQVKNLTGQVYVPSFNNFNNGLDFWDIEAGYLVKTFSPITLNIVGGQEVDLNVENVPLYSGWNLIAYWLQGDSDPIDVFDNIVTDVIQVKSLSGAYVPSFNNFNNMGNMNDTRGYMVKMIGPNTLSYDAADILPKPAPGNVNENERLKPVHFIQEIKPNPNTSTMLIINDEYNTLNYGDELGVFAKDGLLVGAFVFEDAMMGGLIFGDDDTEEGIDGILENENYLFKIWDKNLNRERSVEMEFIQGSTSYKKDDLCVVGFKANNITGINAIDGLTISVTPNPASSQITFDINLSKTENFIIEIYNADGKLVEAIFEGKLPTGNSNVDYDINHLPSGIYIYKISNGKQYISDRLMIRN